MKDQYAAFHYRPLLEIPKEFRQVELKETANFCQSWMATINERIEELEERGAP